ncbi:hypothetical protein [Roseateles aquae]|nr:hypothetical protein [Paucibacter sp. APW11]
MALIFALLALVALTMGAVALIRSVDAGVLALGNLSYKQGGVSASAKGAEAAVSWLRANLAGTVLDADVVAQGYYAASRDDLDVTGRTLGSANVMAQVDWAGDNCAGTAGAAGAPVCIAPSPAVTVGDTSVRYVITRLCTAVGTTAAGNNCAVPVLSANAQGAGRGSLNTTNYMRFGGATYSAYYRIVTRSLGPRGTVAFTETLVHF